MPAKPRVPLMGGYRNKKGMLLIIYLQRQPNIFSYWKMFHTKEIYAGGAAPMSGG
jgi:hypothetical protein